MGRDLWSVGLIATAATTAGLLTTSELLLNSNYINSKYLTSSKQKPNLISKLITSLINLNYSLKFKLWNLLGLGGQFGGFISKIIVYPIKSVGKGIEVNSWEITQFGGLKFDREFVFASKFTNSTKPTEKDIYIPLTQRQKARLSLIDVEFIKTSNLNESLNGYFIIKYPFKDSNGSSSFKLPAVVNSDILNLESPKTLDVFGALIESYSIKNIVPEDFNYHLDLPEDTLLFYSFDGRPVKTGSPNINQLQDIDDKNSRFRYTTFHDYYPILFFSQEDLNHLQKSINSSNSKFQNTMISPNQFRTNLVISGTSKIHDSDNWSFFKIHNNKDGSVHDYKIGSKCARCPLPNVDINKGEMDKRYPITNTISKYRRINPGDNINVFFGVYAIQLDSGYFINVGDSIEITGRKIVPYVDFTP